MVRGLLRLMWNCLSFTRLIWLQSLTAATLALWATWWWAGNWTLALIVAMAAALLATWIAGSRAGESSRSEDARRYSPKPKLEVVENPDAAALVDQLLAQGRYCLLLRPQLVGQLSTRQRAQALEALDAEMALAPVGGVEMRGLAFGSETPRAASVGSRRVHVEAFYIDRQCVTNREFQAFVDADGYEDMSLWSPDVWPGVVGLVDQSGAPGPRHWRQGTYCDGEDDLPVVGVSWHEAAAYARWVGKRLPSDPEWVKAAAWPVPAAGSALHGRRFPWGDSLDSQRANLWGAGRGGIAPVAEFAGGLSVGGVSQMIGNVWEWTSGRYGAWEPSLEIDSPVALRSLRGGAFDTYFETQAQCQFQSGDSPMARKHNIGFRCVVGAADLALSTLNAPEELLPEEDELDDAWQDEPCATDELEVCEA